MTNDLKPGNARMRFPIEDMDAPRSDLRAEVLERFVEYCAANGHRPVGRPVYTFTPGETSWLSVEARVVPAGRTWVEAVIAA